MNLSLNLQELKTPEDIQRLVSVLSQMAEELDVLYTDTAPNGSISARIGRVAIYKNGSTYEQWQNTDGGTTWQRIGAESFVAGDWIVSSVTTARSGWTNVTATYSNKFMRINATPLSTGGADTHSHTIAEANLPSHSHASGTLAVDSQGAHTHILEWGSGNNEGQGDYTNDPMDDVGGASSSGPVSLTWADSFRAIRAKSNGAHTHTVSGSTGAIGSGTAMTGDNVPAYVQVCIFQKS